MMMAERNKDFMVAFEGMDGDDFADCTVESVGEEGVVYEQFNFANFNHRVHI